MAGIWTKQTSLRKKRTPSIASFKPSRRVLPTHEQTPWWTIRYYTTPGLVRVVKTMVRTRAFFKSIFDVSLRQNIALSLEWVPSALNLAD